MVGNYAWDICSENTFVIGICTGVAYLRSGGVRDIHVNNACIVNSVNQNLEAGSTSLKIRKGEIDFHLVCTKVYIYLKIY